MEKEGFIIVRETIHLTRSSQQLNAVSHQTISDNNKIINNRYDCRCDKYYTHSDFTIATLFIKKEKV